MDSNSTAVTTSTPRYDETISVLLRDGFGALSKCDGIPLGRPPECRHDRSNRIMRLT